MSEWYYFKCDYCGMNNAKAFEMFPSPLRESLPCLACGKKPFLMTWNSISGLSDLEGKPYKVFDTVAKEPSIPVWSPIPQISYESEIARLNERIRVLEASQSKTNDGQIIAQMKELLNLIIKQQLAAKLRKVDERFVENEKKIFELTDIIQWKFQNQ